MRISQFLDALAEQTGLESTNLRTVSTALASAGLRRKGAGRGGPTVSFTEGLAILIGAVGAPRLTRADSYVGPLLNQTPCMDQIPKSIRDPDGDKRPPISEGGLRILAHWLETTADELATFALPELLRCVSHQLCAYYPDDAFPGIGFEVMVTDFSVVLVLYASWTDANGKRQMDRGIISFRHPARVAAPPVTTIERQARVPMDVLRWLAKVAHAGHFPEPAPASAEWLATKFLASEAGKATTLNENGDWCLSGMMHGNAVSAVLTQKDILAVIRNFLLNEAFAMADPDEAAREVEQVAREKREAS